MSDDLLGWDWVLFLIGSIELSSSDAGLCKCMHHNGSSKKMLGKSESGLRPSIAHLHSFSRLLQRCANDVS